VQEVGRLARDPSRHLVGVNFCSRPSTHEGDVGALQDSTLEPGGAAKRRRACRLAQDRWSSPRISRISSVEMLETPRL